MNQLKQIKDLQLSQKGQRLLTNNNILYRLFYKFSLFIGRGFMVVKIVGCPVIFLNCLCIRKATLRLCTC